MTGNLSFAFPVIAGSTGNLCIVRCPIRSGMTSIDVGMTSTDVGMTSTYTGMTSIDELSEFRADDEFLVVALFHAADHLCIYAEAL